MSYHQKHPARPEVPSTARPTRTGGGIRAAPRLPVRTCPAAIHCQADTRPQAVDGPDQTGFGYGTLPGHPEQGEESFTVERNIAGDVWFVVRAFSRPATWFARLGAPITRRIQESITDIYAQALRPPAGGQS